MKISDKLKKIIERDTGLIVFDLYRTRTRGHLKSLGVPLWIATCDCTSIGSRATMTECVNADAVKFIDDTELGFVDLVIPAPNAKDQRGA